MKALQYIISGLVLYFIFLLKLTGFHIRSWDESWYAVNAYEMMQHHSYFVTYFNGGVDHISNKPCLLMWFFMLAIKCFGFNLLAIRITSALAGIFSALILFRFLSKQNYVAWAWCSFLVLITSTGFVYFHSSRTGDTDALLTFFLLLSNIYFFNFLHSGHKRNLSLFLYILFLGLAFDVKSFAALLFLPGHLYLLIHYKLLKSVFTLKGTYYGIAAFLVIVAFFILGRQVNDPFYLKSLFVIEATRFSSVNDTHGEPFDFYFNNFYTTRFSIWYSVFIISLVLFALKKTTPGKPKNMVMVWAISLFVSYFIIITLSASKLYWYDIPLYPYMAIITGYGLSYLINNVSIIKLPEKYQPFIYILFFCVPVYFAIKHSNDNEIVHSEKKAERISEYLFMKENEGKSLDNYSVCDNDFIGPLLFYKHQLADKGQRLNIVDLPSVTSSNTVIVKNDSIKKHLRQKFNCTVIDSFKEVAVYHIGDVR